MRLKTSLSLLLIAAPLASPLGAAAPAPGDLYTWLQGQAAYFKQQDSPCVQDATALGIAGGQWVCPQGGWEVSFLSGKLTDGSSRWKAREDDYHASALYSPFGVREKWRPFGRAGIGLSYLEAPASLAAGSTVRPNLVLGVGTQYLLERRGLLSLEARWVNLRTLDPRSEFQFIAGFGLRWSRTMASR
jgi:hypothetical protein